VEENRRSILRKRKLLFRQKKFCGQAALCTNAGEETSHSPVSGTAGLIRMRPLCSATMFDPIREKIETAAQKTTQLRRFL
jgi:hypothetical protein